MVTGILNRIDEIKERYAHLVGAAFKQGGGASAALDRLWEVAFGMATSDHMYYAYQVIEQHVADRFFTMWQQQIGEPAGLRPDGAAYTMPLHSTKKDEASQFLQKKGMSLDVQNRIYPCRIVDWRLANVLAKSKYYKTVQQVYKDLSGHDAGDSAEVVAAKKALDDALKKLRTLTAEVS